MRHPFVGNRLRQRCPGRGAITIEFALVFLPLVAFLFAIIDAGRFIGARVMLSQAVSEGARTAALSTTTNTTAVDTAVRGAAPLLNGLTLDAVDCTIGNSVNPCLPDLSGKTVGDRVTVTASYPFTAMFISPFTRTLTQTSWTVVEW